MRARAIERHHDMIEAASARSAASALGESSPPRQVGAGRPAAPSWQTRRGRGEIAGAAAALKEFKVRAT